jgi:hypothetical protein
MQSVVNQMQMTKMVQKGKVKEHIEKKVGKAIHLENKEIANHFNILE